MSNITINVYENDNFFNISNNSDSQIFSPHSSNSGISGNSGVTELPFGNVAGNFMGRHDTPADVVYQKYNSDSTFPSPKTLRGQYETSARIGTYARIGRDIVNGVKSSVSELNAKATDSVWKENIQYQPGETVVAGDGRTYKALRPTIGEGPWSHTAPGSPYAKNDPAWAVVSDGDNARQFRDAYSFG